MLFKSIGMIIKSQKSGIIPPLLIITVLLSSTLVSCVSPSKPAEPSEVSPGQQLIPHPSESIFSQDVAAESTVRLTNGEWPPYLSENLEHYGVVSRIVTEAFALEGVKVEFGFFPWKRAYELAKSGEWDGSVVWLSTPEREKDFYFSEPIMQCSYVFWHLKSFDFDWQNIDDLQDVTVGGTSGYFYEEIFSSLEEEGKIKVEWVSQDEQNFKKLLTGRIDLYAQDIAVANSMLRNIFTPEETGLITYHPQPLDVADNCLLLSRQVEGNERLLTLFNKGFQRLRESGKLERYLAEALETGR